MTRFARAKGSKASNERVPEEATSWSEMKQQLLEKNNERENIEKQKEALEKRTANYKAFLEEKEKDNSKNTSWSKFPGDSNSTQKEKKVCRLSFTNNISKERNNTAAELEKNNGNMHDTFVNVKESDSEELPDEQSSKKQISEPSIAKKKKVQPKKLLKIASVQSKRSKDNTSILEENSKPEKKRKVTENQECIKKKLKKDVNYNEDSVTSKQNSKSNKDIKKIVKENLTDMDLKKIEKKKQRRIRQLEKKKKLKADLKIKMQKEEEMKALGNSDVKIEEVNNQNSVQSFDKVLNSNNYQKKPINNSNAFTDMPKKKLRDNKEHPRKKPLLPHKMFINGKELEIDYVDGFPVKKEDALRLKKLRREMISKGLPRSEINIALKLERRKAEKAFTREKKKVCFHCRKSGHNLSECPNFDKNEVAQTAATGICFKCGSTEHTHFECKVVRGQEFKYATCFVCNEQGHIARQCPDNARGLYPKGGACKVCGDVTHLKKDCPKYQAQQQREEENMRIEIFGNSNPDILEEKGDDKGGTLPSKKPNKIIKF